MLGNGHVRFGGRGRENLRSRGRQASRLRPQHLPLDQASANWIFQMVSRRYEKGSIVLTSNRGFGDWNQVFADPVVASAIVDRLLHNATVINIKGHSYRMRRYDAAQQAKGGRAMVA